MRAFAPLAALAALLGGCGHSAETVQVPAAAPAAPEPVPDGLWRGTSTRFQADSRGCPGPGLLALDVQNRTFVFRWGRGISVDVAIQPDGSLAGQSGDITVVGRYAGGRIEGDATSPSCGLHFRAVKRS